MLKIIDTCQAHFPHFVKKLLHPFPALRGCQNETRACSTTPSLDDPIHPRGSGAERPRPLPPKETDRLKEDPFLYRPPADDKSHLPPRLSNFVQFSQLLF
ncbi:hypothetical protein CEXT_685021 [Caerostris extrusa]|uniref:Uncharacterized protein n=1 Tax=Caerostris extrusa TaxID=172846 RepID=A0AAV4V140_CAEEX|nr:hypothetical protein CEXT_685021 [Caerostris extrusa]